jgi:hypothetical protein
MTRDKTVLQVAKMLAMRDGNEWLAHTNGPQGKRQSRYLSEANVLVRAVEQSMKDFAWHPEPETV